MTLKPHRTPADRTQDIIKSQAAICLTLLFFIFTNWGFATEQGSSSETVTLTEAVRIPIHGKGKQVGATTVPAGTKVTVVTRDGEKVSVKHGALEPVWVEESQLSGLSDKKPEQPSKPVTSDPAINLQKLSRMVSEKKWPQVAAACEAMAQADEKFSGLAELAGQLKSALQAQTSAVQQQKKAETEAQRLRRNADVVGQPNRLNPSDRSPMERAQKLREEADSVIEKAYNAYAASETQIAQSGADISKEIGRMESEATAPITSVDTRSEKISYNPKDSDEKARQKTKLSAALLVLDWPITTHTHEEALRQVNEMMNHDLLPRVGLTLEECVRRAPVSPNETYEHNSLTLLRLKINLGDGWTSNTFRCGDIIVSTTFDPSGEVAGIRLFHVEHALSCKDVTLLDRLSKYNFPTLHWEGTLGLRTASEADVMDPLAWAIPEDSQIQILSKAAARFLLRLGKSNK